MANPGENCERHEREIERLRDQVRAQEAELARRETVVVGLQHDMHALSERVPADLGQWMGTVSTKLDTMARGQNDVVSALREGYVTVAELETAKSEHSHFATKSDLENLKTELKPITASFWKAAAIVFGLLITGLVTLLIEARKLAPLLAPK